MRIISGFLGGRRIQMPKSMPSRPTTDLAKEGLFNILQNQSLDLEKTRGLDLFAGTGNISYELISRGVQHMTVVEKDPGMIQFMKKTAEQFQIQDQMQFVKGDALKFVSSSTQSFDLIFADPPYALKEMLLLPDMILQKKMLADNGLLIIEHASGTHFETHPACKRVKQYGDSAFSFFQQ